MASADFFLKIDGIEGESLDKQNPKELQLESWSFGATNAGSSTRGTGGGTGKVSMQDFHFVVMHSKASPKLFEKCCTGEHIKNATLTCRLAGGTQQTFLKYIFTDILVASFQTGGSGHGGSLPTDQISFNFTKIEVRAKEQKADGTLGPEIPFGYDLKLNSKV